MGADLPTPERIFAGVLTMGVSEIFVAVNTKAARAREQARIARIQASKVEKQLKTLEEERKIENEKAKEEIKRLTKLNAEIADLKRQRENEENNRNIERAKWLREKEARVKEERDLMKVNVQDYSVKKNKQFNNYLKCVSNLPAVRKTIKRSVAFLGKTSCGKSTMINKIYGTKCKTSPLRCTQGAEKVHDSDNLEVYDVYGVNDEETYANVNVLLTTKRLHIVVCIYTDAVDHVLHLAQLMNALKLDIVFIRNKSEDLTAEEIKEVKQHEESKLMGFVDKKRFLGVIIGSGKTGLGMKALRDTITMPQITDDEKMANEEMKIESMLI